MKRRFVTALSWLLVLLCMTVIFFLSSQDGESSAKLSEGAMGPIGRFVTFLFGEEGHNVFRKFAHFFEYAGLGLLVYNAFFRTRKEKRLSPYMPYLFCLLYAISDEIHQCFVPGRAGMVFDVGVDALGVILGMSAFFVLAKIFIFMKLKKKIT